MSDPGTAAEILSPSQEAATRGAAQIELRYLPIGHRGHAFLRLVDADGGIMGELHGLVSSKNRNKIVPVGFDGADLVAMSSSGDYFGKGRSRSIATVASGAAADMEERWAQGLKAVEKINRKKFDYKASDLSYELGSDGGQIQNSNSVAFTLGRAMNLDLDDAVQKAGTARKFPGWARDLLDPNYERYVAPPVFPVTNAS